MIKWIDSSKSLPKDKEVVAAVCVGHLVEAWYSVKDNTWRSYNCKYHSGAVSHWARINKPKLP